MVEFSKVGRVGEPPAPRAGECSGAARRGRPWSMDEYELLIAGVMAGVRDEVIADGLQRPVGGVQAAVNRLLPSGCQGSRIDATSTLRALLPGLDWRAAARNTLRRRTITSNGSGIEQAVRTYLEGRARIEAQLLQAVQEARDSGTDEATIRLALERCSAQPLGGTDRYATEAPLTF